jgi:hypothetical protein
MEMLLREQHSSAGVRHLAVPRDYWKMLRVRMATLAMLDQH